MMIHTGENLGGKLVYDHTAVKHPYKTNNIGITLMFMYICQNFIPALISD